MRKKQKPYVYNYSIIVPAYNSGRILTKTLKAIKKAMKANGSWKGELIVVDNNSKDDTKKIARKFTKKVIFEKINLIPRARNKGAKKAKGEYLIWIDDDTIINKKLLKETLETLDTGKVCAGTTTITFSDKKHKFYWPAKVGLLYWRLYSRIKRCAIGMYMFGIHEGYNAIGGLREDITVGDEIYFSKDMRKWGKNKKMRFEVLKTPLDYNLRKLEKHSWQKFLLSQSKALFFESYRKKKNDFWYNNKTNP